MKEYVSYRVRKAFEAFDDALILATHSRWNACVNRLYYACFYMISALAIQIDFESLTHSGLKTLFSLHFIKTGKVSREFGKLYSDLFDWRQKGDYNDHFDFDKESIEPVIPIVKAFLDVLADLIGIEEETD